MAPRRIAVMFSGLLCAALFLSPALADDLVAPDPGPAPSPGYFTIFQEVRAGVYAHNLIHDEGAPVDLSVEALSSPINFPGYSNPSISGNPWVSWFFDPRINLGGMINTGGKTSYGFAGFTWRIPIYGPIFFEGEFGGAVNDSPLHPENNRVDMGCRFTFRESGGFGVQFNEHMDLIATVEHVSHASFCTSVNPGLTQFGVRVGYKF